MEGVEFVNQSQYEVVVVIDNAMEALKAGLGSGNEEVIHCLDPGLRGMMPEGVTWWPR